MQVGFAENCSFQLQSEVQSRHWFKPQIRFCMAFIWNVENKLYSCAVITDEIEDDSIMG
jgi:hypothetical protein